MLESTSYLYLNELKKRIKWLLPFLSGVGMELNHGSYNLSQPIITSYYHWVTEGCVKIKRVYINLDKNEYLHSRKISCVYELDEVPNFKISSLI